MGARGGADDDVRASAAWVVERTLSSLAPVSVFLDSALSRCGERDHALLRELTLGCLRWLRRIDHVITCASNRRFTKIETDLRGPLRIATYQLLFLDRVPAHAAVHEAVEHARRVTHKGGASFTNAVLRRIARSPHLDEWPVDSPDSIERLAIENSHPDFLVRGWLNRLGIEQTRGLLAANNRPKAMQLLAFRDRGGRELLAERLIDEGISVEPALISPLGLTVREGNPLTTHAFQRGDFYVQDEGSQASALIPTLRPDETVLDAAAAPGGKTFAMLAMEPELSLFLGDVSLARTMTLRSNLQRMSRAQPMIVMDARRPATAMSFDRVVVDLPCTGTGTLRKHPELKWRISENEVGRLSRQAFDLLRGCAERVKRDGLLVAITCSLEPEENEEVVARFLEARKDFSLLSLEEHLSYPLNGWIASRGCWRLLPAHDHDGFTVHVLVRKKAD